MNKSSSFYIKLRSLYKNKEERQFFKLRKNFYKSLLNPGDLVFDVGANIGNRVEAFLALNAKVVAVEPQSFCRKVLRIKFGSKIEIVEEGLGEKEETKTMHISNANTISSFAEDWIEKVKEGRFKEYEWNEKEEIRMTTLEHLISKYGAPKFIKIDVEGFELQVLKGLKQPIDIISLEYTVPEETEKAIDCVTYLHHLSDHYQFNYSTGESMQLELDEFIPFDRFMELLKSKEFNKTSNGDIYAKIIKK